MDSDRKRGEILKDFQILTFSYLITIQRYRKEGTASSKLYILKLNIHVYLNALQ